MNWTKVTPETLPPDGESVMVTVKYGKEKAVLLGKFCDGEFHRKSEFVDEYLPMPKTFKVTHWAAMPAPAEDE